MTKNLYSKHYSEFTKIELEEALDTIIPEQREADLRAALEWWRRNCQRSESTNREPEVTFTAASGHGGNSIMFGWYWLDWCWTTALEYTGWQQAGVGSAIDADWLEGLEAERSPTQCGMKCSDTSSEAEPIGTRLDQSWRG